MSVKFDEINYDGRVELEEGLHLVTFDGIHLTENKKQQATICYEVSDVEGRQTTIRTIMDGKDEKQLSEAFSRLGQIFVWTEGFKIEDLIAANKAADKEAEGNWEVLVNHLNKLFKANKTEKRLKVLVTSSWYMGNRNVGVPPFGAYADKFDGTRLVFNPAKHVAPLEDPKAGTETPTEGHEPVKKGSKIPGLE